ncbi:MAG: hydrolase [Caenispirillum sp.]|nr:hydrolase [Caenispirillum sp.]
MTTTTPKDYNRWLDWLDGRQEAMLARLVEWSAINSGTRNLAGLERMAERLTEAFAALDPATAEALPLPDAEEIGPDGAPRVVRHGRMLRFVFNPQANRRVLMVIHYDTVFPADSPFQTARRIDADTLHGPGVADAKGGICVILAAVEAFLRSPWGRDLGIEVLLNPDEETGSIGSAPLLADAAGRAQFALLYEPALPDGTLAGARKGSGNFSVVVRGKAAHAGRAFHEGRNAVVALARVVGALHALNAERPTITLNVAKLEGGGPTNVVPDLAIARFNVRTESHADQHWMEDRLRALITEADATAEDGITVTLAGGFTRPPKEIVGRTAALYDWVKAAGGVLGQPIAWVPTGGCCDGNNLAAAGLPNVDTLGVRGGLIHSDREFMTVSSLTERARLSALLLMRAAAEGLPWETAR